MKYTAKIEEFGQGNYVRTIIFTASDVDHLDDLITIFENDGPCGEVIQIDDSLMPPRFGEAGGFASKLLSFVDENGNDISDMWKM